MEHTGHTRLRIEGLGSTWQQAKKDLAWRHLHSST